MPRPREASRDFAATIRPVSDLVLIASDVYGAATDVPHPLRGTPLPALSRIARYGTVEPLPEGWRAWLASALGREDLASAAPASIADAASIADGASIAREVSSSTAPADPESGRPYLWLTDPLHLIVG